MARRFIVRGVVQGVGYRPFVYRLAHEHDIGGTVANSSRGVIIEAEGSPEALARFEQALSSDAPVLARVESVAAEDAPPIDARGFAIRESEQDETESTLICPDVAVCPDCLAEFLDSGDRRHHYPFINCTNCGPRFSIIDETPYDRPKTSMGSFHMCDACQSEYDDPLDRRFHAQPNACPDCGPKLTLVTPRPPHACAAEILLGRSYVRMPDDVVAAVDSDPAAATRWLLSKGAIVGVRGLGGFHIAANAVLDETVRALREKKNRPAKPFAVMCRDLDVVRKVARVSDEEAEALSSPWSPIVLLRKRADAEGTLSRLVAPDNSCLGVMLPYAPVHHLLFDDSLEALVMTSANASGEPIIASVDDAGRLAGVTSTFLDHDREVVNRNDDSVVFVSGGHVAMSRRSRGYAPYPIDLGVPTADVLGCGTELKNTFTLLKDGRAFVSQHMGDMENQATLDLYEEMVAKFAGWFRFEPGFVAHDLHPDYLATRFAKRLAEGNDALTLVGVQHHHAHIASVLAENRATEPVIGVALDGTGYGTDGKIWGCEFLVADAAGFRRAAHLKYVPLPGGDAAIVRPYRGAMSHLVSAGLPDPGHTARRLFPEVPDAERDLVLQQLAKGVNCIDTSSAGRLFDAVSAILGVCHEISYEAQAAIELESLIDPDGGTVQALPYDIIEDGETLVVDPSRTVLAVLAAVEAGAKASEVSAAFHETVVEFVRDVCARIRDATGIETTALSGGVFQNQYLLRRLTEALTQNGFTVLLNREVPANDGGVSLGQAAIANELARGGQTKTAWRARGGVTRTHGTTD